VFPSLRKPSLPWKPDKGLLRKDRRQPACFAHSSRRTERSLFSGHVLSFAILSDSDPS
jgi:hypothetical protein